MNYKAFNIFTISNRNTLLLIKEIFVKLYAVRIYSKFDIIAAFNEIRVKKDYEEKIAFLTRYSLFEYIIIPFGLYNTLITFQIFINNTLREYLNIFYIIYLDDILIYSNIKNEYI